MNHITLTRNSTVYSVRVCFSDGLYWYLNRTTIPRTHFALDLFFRHVPKMTFPYLSFRLVMS